ncbi:helicase with zinc finger domain 2 isoform X1 [Pimephales promelas]|uniref:helicase with zinc finger domain 2 isoform X1 n=1 Tax=Pimephales promelas TaxID=90988 RepID=UPI0019556023|nr:helicase with zinc finger domain 2 isoform X1 [Pimephales promelas]XP_039515592.1 helicase with zinc finger domain 2 isoform X1 [Pimephales promelas]
METSESDSASSSNTEVNHAETDCKILETLEPESELCMKDIEKLLTTNPKDFKHCKLEIERHDQACARPLDEPTLSIKIYGRKNVGRSFPGDEVCVEILSREKCPGQGEVIKGRVVGLINRNENSLSFICKMVEDNPQYVIPINKCMTRIHTVQNKKDTGKIEVRQYESGRWVRKESVNIAENQLLVVKVLKWENRKTFPLGVVTKVIPMNDAWREILCIELGSKNTPPPFKLQAPEDDEALKREDLCDVITFTIDPTSAEDLDDGFSVTELQPGDSYQIGVHITDVASYIPKDSEHDKFARQRGRTIYTSEKEDVAFMFPRDLSNEYLSLTPNKPRKAISLLIEVDKKTSEILNSRFALTRIKSDRRMSYEEADQIIEKYYYSDDAKPLRVSCVEDCVAIAYRFSEVHRKCRLEGEWAYGMQAGQSYSHVMVEELMNLYNSAAAEELISKDVTRDLTPLRCQRKPDPEQLEQFREKYMNLIPMSLYFSNICEVDGENSEEDVWTNAECEHAGISLNIFTSIFHKMEEFAQTKDYNKLMQLIFSDEIHPTFVPMVREFREIQKKAFIFRSCSSLDSRLGHYDLQLNAYTWASSPMRRYLDLILQRLLHTVLSKKTLKQADYTQDEINRFCQSGMDAEEKEAQLLRLINVQFEPKNVVKLAVVDQITPQGHEFTISFPLHPTLTMITIMYKHLKVVDQPKYNKDKNSMTLHWKRRVYSFGKSFKISEPMKNATPVSSILWRRLRSAVKQRDWVKTEQCLRDMKRGGNENEENEEVKVEQHFKELTIKLELGKVVQVQLGHELKDGLPVPVVLLLSINECFEICLEHTRNPTVCFAKAECNASKTIYNGYKEYQNIWRRLCQIDTAYNALEENNNVILEDVRIKWSGNETNLQGFFYLTKTQKKEWSLEFDLSNCFLCIRLRHQKPQNDYAKQSRGSAVSDLQGSLPFTWVAHAVTSKPKKKKDTDKNDRINFQITQRSMSYIPPEVNAKETKFTIEVIPKKIPFVLREQAIASLKRANNLVKNVATRQQLEKLNDDADVENFDLYDVDESLNLNLPPLNESQQKAVEEAMKKPFTVIQGPPGTGKTVVGIHIVYQYFMKNKNFLPTSESSKSTPDKKPPKKPAILYCGPSNKSVDIVAEQLLKLRGVLKPLRIYCDQMEMREYKYLGSDLKLCRRSLRDEKPNEKLRDINLMYLVREPENPLSEKVETLRKSETEDEIDDYKAVLKEAHQHEIRKCDVVLCTCASALKPEIREVMDFRQILIDECAMATEPEAFIPLVSYNPQQIVLLGDHKQIRPIVQCALVNKMGMRQSLFERYMDLAIMLDTQYRMHEEICRFPSEEFYEGKLKTGAERGPPILLNKRGLPTPILFGHVQGEEVSLVVSTEKGNENSMANTEEAEQAVNVADLLIKAHVPPQNIAILTPYNAQMSEIKKTMEERNITNVTVCTIMKSQGSEWPYVILSTVRSCSVSDIKSHTPSNAWLGKRLGFITDPNQVNVAITRAQDGLCILGNSELLRCCKLWNRLLDHYYRKSCVVNPASDIKVEALPKRRRKQKKL